MTDVAETLRRAEQLQAIGYPEAVCEEGPPNSEHETYSLCIGGVDGPSHRCYAMLIGADVNKLAKTASEIEAAFAVIHDLVSCVLALQEQVERAKGDGIGIGRLGGDVLVAEYRFRTEAAERRVQALEAELEAEHAISSNDPAEQRAERYAQEALELSGRIIKLKAYVRHKKECPYGKHPIKWIDDQQCSCGLDTLLITET